MGPGQTPSGQTPTANVMEPSSKAFPVAVSELDIWRSAQILIAENGEQADLYAAIRADQCLEEGDTEGVAVWMRIKRAIEELQRKTPTSDREVN